VYLFSGLVGHLVGEVRRQLEAAGRSGLDQNLEADVSIF
jgi:hypothetical protein